MHFENEIEHKILVTYVIVKVSICIDSCLSFFIKLTRQPQKSRLKIFRRPFSII
ncbi:hypothetical protein [Neisseria sicca]|uniref:hypothetical protein n=1 Tax=Neisseria sicca TaxID=490 RepID=UPI001649FA47|nr:hypothetical protein [Neisseria sicca]